MKRRTFLTGIGLAGAGLVAGAAGGVARAAGDLPTGQEMATLFDLEQCIGCGACAEACREANGHRFPEPEKPFPRMYPDRVKVEDWSERRDVDDRLTPYNWLYVDTVNVMHEGEEREISIPRRCMHCVNPPCADLCPWGAAAKEADGSVAIDTGICLGGAKCRSVCPWHIPQRQTGVGLYLDIAPSLAGNGVMYKCDRCAERRARGELPACIEACPNEVQTIGPRDEIVARAKALAKERGAYLYGLEENGGTNTIYLSPVPFETIHAALDVGPGRPGLAPVENSMGHGGKLAAAIALAPLAGLAAGFLRTVRAVKGHEAGDKEDDHA